MGLSQHERHRDVMRSAVNRPAGFDAVSKQACVSPTSRDHVIQSSPCSPGQSHPPSL